MSRTFESDIPRSAQPDRQLWVAILAAQKDPQLLARIIRDYAADQIDTLAAPWGDHAHADVAHDRATQLREF